MKNIFSNTNVLKKFFEASENLSNVTLYQVSSGGRYSGRTYFLSMLYKEQVEDIFYRIEKQEFIKHVETLMTEFRSRYEKLPIAYPGDYIFYTMALNCIKTFGAKNILVENLRDSLENHFVHIEIGMYTKN